MKKTKKILIDGAIFALQNSGGISRIFSEMILGLDQSHLGNLIVLLPKNQNIEWSSVALHLKKAKIVKRKKPSKSFFLESLFLTLIAFWYRPHIWHSSYYIGFPLFWKRPKVITFHDMMGEIFRINSLQETNNKYLSLKACDRIFAISHHAAGDLKKIWPHFLPKIKVVTNGLDMASVDQKKQERPYLIYIGKRGSYKNFLPSVKKILKDAQFDHLQIFVVGGEKVLSEEEKNLERVKWFGILPRNELEKLIASAEALLFPSLYEGFGLPLLEAFSLEVPVLAYRVSCIPEVVGVDYPLAEIEKEESLNLTLAKLLRERPKWIAYGRERKKMFTRETMVNALLQEYETL